MGECTLSVLYYYRWATDTSAIKTLILCSNLANKFSARCAVQKSVEENLNHVCKQVFQMIHLEPWFISEWTQLCCHCIKKKTREAWLTRLHWAHKGFFRGPGVFFLKGVSVFKENLRLKWSFSGRVKMRGNHRREAVFLKQNELQLADRRVRRAGAVTDHRKGKAPLTWKLTSGWDGMAFKEAFYKL